MMNENNKTKPIYLCDNIKKMNNKRELHRK